MYTASQTKEAILPTCVFIINKDLKRKIPWSLPWWMEPILESITYIKLPVCLSEMCDEQGTSPSSYTHRQPPGVPS